MVTVVKPGPRSKRGVGREGSKALGNLVRQRREAMGLSQEDLAHRLGYGSRGSVSPIESGSRAVTAADKVQRLAEVLDISPDTIYTLQGYVPHDVYDDITGFTPAQMERLRSFIRSEL